ncbi:hypothetical protein GCM10007972_24430 [Iodidimonas muriae]|uniref:Uncharacterized protein n=1 Tax=Iodidimonas muriae TaxID=261467 RepID=A0ABQ2LFS0_9PROT|nr:hypothetical protein [Iodidimonas muriae]GER08833.1 hypothetical protein JCM17843_31430 [Kordiimonadales bacterium JCM 17843]GGO15887.1 hypothetical protein GCM10007972_24430 [Iodidimonas muriae]
MDTTLAGPNAIDPMRMTPDERNTEVGRILGAGLVRLHARQSSELSADSGESSLDFSPPQRRHANPGSEAGAGPSTKRKA